MFHTAFRYVFAAFLLTISALSLGETTVQYSYPNKDTADGFIYKTFENELYLTVNITTSRINSVEDVMKLQKFLTMYEKANIQTTGIYDQTTIDAVNRFQEKYARAILHPWGITKATGNVGVMTRAYINNIVYGTDRKINCPGFTDSVQYGQTSPDLPYIRRFFIHMGYALSNSDSYHFDKELREVIKQFQQDHADAILQPLGMSKPSGNWYRQTRMTANLLVGCDKPEL